MLESIRSMKYHLAQTAAVSKTDITDRYRFSQNYNLTKALWLLPPRNKRKIKRKQLMALLSKCGDTMLPLSKSSCHSSVGRKCPHQADSKIRKKLNCTSKTHPIVIHWPVKILNPWTYILILKFTCLYPTLKISNHTS